MVEQANQESICSRKKEKRKEIIEKELILREERAKMHISVIGAKVVSPKQKDYNKKVRKPGNVTIMVE